MAEKGCWATSGSEASTGGVLFALPCSAPDDACPSALRGHSRAAHKGPSNTYVFSQGHKTIRISDVCGWGALSIN